MDLENGKEIMEHIISVINQATEGYLFEAKEMAKEVYDAGDFSLIGLSNFFMSLSYSLEGEKDGAYILGLAYYDCYEFFEDEVLGVNWIFDNGSLDTLAFKEDFSSSDWDSFRDSYLDAISEDEEPEYDEEDYDDE